MEERWQEAQAINQRIQGSREREMMQTQQTAEAGAASAQGNSPAAVVAAAAGINPTGLKVQTASSTLHRLQIRQREVLNRVSQLQKQLASFESATASSRFSDLSPSSVDPDADLSRVVDFPSAALVARGLQTMGLLPDARRGEPILLSLGSNAMLLAPASSSSSAAVQSMPARSGSSSSKAASASSVLSSGCVSIPASVVPPLSAYAPRHFLSHSHIPLLHMDTLHKQQEQQRLEQQQQTPQQQAGASPASAAAAGSMLPEVSFHREMFLKVPHKQLPYTLQE